MKKILAFVALMFLSISAEVACTTAPASPPTRVSAAETSAQPAPAAPAAASGSQPESEFLASGPIIVEQQVHAAAQGDGLMTKIRADAGTWVKKGQLLAALDDRKITADLEAARAKTRSTEADLKNWQAEAKVLESDYARAEKLW